MKTAILLIAILGITACDLNNGRPPIKPSFGMLDAKMNGEQWSKTYKNAYQVVESYLAGSSSSFPCQGNNLVVRSELYSNDRILRQQLFFTKIPNAAGKYPIIPSVYNYCVDSDSVYCDVFSMHDDSINGVYHVVSGNDNYFVMDQYDHAKNEIKGRFQVTLAINSGSGQSSLPDTLRFTEGKFHTKILDIY